MKILAIRGCNLASLAGEFEIDLARGPLGGAGVFAIVGNTGAGKTTLLDALCVALFDRTPRLTNHSTVKIGRGSDDRALLGAQDVRTLLRRGTAQGWAEVDFESGDARQYRARWSVRRARGQSDGTLQDEQLSLTAIDGGERLGGTKTETLRAIHARLGLSFDQFRRSALLAQGEFAAFLRADGKDRSELLERMTGTQIYSRLSIAAHVKAAVAEQRLRDGRAAALAIAVMGEDAERAARAELEVAAVAARAVRRRHAQAIDAARWIAEAARRERELAEASADHATARAAVIAAEADRAELALRRRAELLRPAWDAADRLERGAVVAAGEAAAAGDAAVRAGDALAEIAARRARIAAAHAPVRAARIAAGIVERGAPADRAAPELAGADDAAWLAARAALAPEIAAWPELDARFAQHAALGEAIAALDRALGEQAEAKARLERAHKVIAGEVQAAAHRHDDARRKAAGYAQRRGLTLDAARRLEDEARNRLAEAERVVGIAAAARAAIAAQDELDRQLTGLAAAAADDAAQLAGLGEAQRLAHALRAEQSQVVDGLRRAAGYEHARAELTAGQPCPLCGATEHPWRDRGALDDVIASAADRLAGTLAELDAIATRTAAIAARDQQHGREHTRLTRQREALAASAASLVTTWRDELGALGELMLVDDPAAPAAEALAADRQALARKKLEDARTTRSQTEAATKAAQDAQADVQLCQVALDQLAVKLAEHDRRLADLDATLGRLRGERASKREHHGALEAELAAAMARWIAALPEPSDANDASDASEASDAERGARRDRTGHGVIELRPRTGAGDPAAASRTGGPAAASRTIDPAAASRTIDPAAASRTGGPAAASRTIDPAAASRTDGPAAASRTGGPAAASRTGGPATASRTGGPAAASRTIDPALALALVARLQASAPAREAAGAFPSSPLAIVRIAMAAVAAAWRERAERIATADAVLSAAAVAIDREARDVDRAVAEHTARRGDAERRRDELGREHAAAVARLDAARGDAGFAADELRRLLSADPSRVDALAERLAALDRDVAHRRAVVTERERQVADHAAARPIPDPDDAAGDAPVDRPDDPDAGRAGDPYARRAGGRGVDPRADGADAGRAGDPYAGRAGDPYTGRAGEPDAGRAGDPDAGRAGDPYAGRAGGPGVDPRAGGDDARFARLAEDASQLEGLAAAVVAADRRAAQLTAALAADADARARRAAALAEVLADEAGAEVDRTLGDVIGSHDGKLFRSFAQSLTLDSLLAVANAHLEELAPRYQLERVPRHDLELQVIDRDLGSEVRSVQSLSGGESFLVSLALALGLSSMSAHDVRVRTLLIDEGFGTLDPATLDSALSVLDALQATGRQVGVISHVPALVERVGAHVRVVQRGGGRSEVIVA